MVAIVPLMLLLSASPVEGTATATTCGDRLEASARAAHKVHPKKKAAAALKALANDCPLLPAVLRDAAARAAPRDAKARSEILGAAAVRLLPAHCLYEKNDVAATALARTCPLPAPLRPTTSELETLDQGTYAFELVTLEALRRTGVRGEARLWPILILNLATTNERHRR